MIVVPTEFHGPEIESYSISIEEIDWWSKQLRVEASGSKKAYAWIRLNLSYHDARGKVIQPTIMNNELLYCNLSKIHSFFSGECGLCWNWWKDYSVLTRNHRSHSPHGTLFFLSSENRFSFRSLNRLSIHIRVPKNMIH